MTGPLTAKNNRKKIIIYTLVAVILFAATSLLEWADPESVDFFFYMALGIALGLGVLHIYLLYEFLLDPTYRDEFWVGFLLTILLALAGAAAGAVLYHYLKLNFYFLTYGLAFVLPYVCWKTYRYFLRIPAPVYKPWYYPLQAEMPDLDMIDLSQIEVVQFVFHKKIQDNSQTNFTSKAPLNMSLGQLFFIFINDYNEKNIQQTIEFLDGQSSPNGWLFFRKKKWFSRRHFFDPDLSFRDNLIQPNEFIYAIRIR
jgi:hypothetical protein